MEYRLFRWINQQDLTQPTDLLITNGKSWLSSLSDQDLIECLLTGFIPDTYEENKTEEKAFAKMMEVLVSEIFSRIGFDSIPLKSRSGVEDIRVTHHKKTILIDVKTYRLGRSQQAPNVKDFVKLNTFKKWIKNFNSSQDASTAIGGMVVYPSTHEWIRTSQAYRECSTKETPILMFTYELLAHLLQNKHSISLTEFYNLWNYELLFPSTVSSRQQYWKQIIPCYERICGIGTDSMIADLDVLKLYYEESIQEAIESLVSSMYEVSQQIPQKVQQMSHHQLESATIHLLTQQYVAPLQKSLNNIEHFRQLDMFAS